MEIEVIQRSRAKEMRNLRMNKKIFIIIISILKGKQMQKMYFWRLIYKRNPSKMTYLTLQVTQMEIQKDL